MNPGALGHQILVLYLLKQNKYFPVRLVSIRQFSELYSHDVCLQKSLPWPRVMVRGRGMSTRQVKLKWSVTNKTFITIY